MRPANLHRECQTISHCELRTFRPITGAAIPQSNGFGTNAGTFPAIPQDHDRKTAKNGQ